MSTNQVRVLHIITRLDPGGSAENTILSVEYVDPERFDSILITGPGLHGAGPPPLAAQRLGSRLHIERHLVRQLQPLLDLQALDGISRFLKHFDPDILHLHSAKAGTLGRLAARLARSRAKVVYTPHGHVFSGYGGKSASAIFTRIERWLAPRADAIVGLTVDEVREFLLHRAGRPEQFCVIPSGVEMGAFLNNEMDISAARAALELPPDAQVVGFIGRFEEVKGPDFALQVMNRLVATDPQAVLLMVGSGSMEEELRRQAVELGIAEKVRWLGWRQDIPALMRAMDVFLLTSRNEGQGRVLVEAMASSLPVVAMDSGGVKEVVADGVTGLIVPTGDVEAAANNLHQLLQSGDSRATLGRVGRIRAIESFSAERMFDRLGRLYNGLIEGRSPADVLPPGDEEQQGES